MSFTTIILAGGKSSRMGQDKGLMFLKGKPMIEHIIDVVKPFSEEILIVANDYNYKKFGVSVFYDEIKEKGPLAGIYTGLKNSSSEWNLILSCDVPYVNERLIKLLIENSNGFDITIPQKDNQTHQLIGVFNKNCIHSFKANLDQNQLKLKNAYESLNLNIVDANIIEDKVFTNINSKDDIKA
ncbi:MAG: molybdenum cofactor guanylyltransferase [Flavobacteriales bacterium]|nr:molybdenum cofactor guanylyltransferase [Flavobacteriales bacterium]